MRTLDYEYVDIRNALVAAIQPFLQEGEFILYRAPFRWFNDKGEVMSNHYEMQSIDYIAEEHNYEIIHDWKHVCVVKRKDATPQI